MTDVALWDAHAHIQSPWFTKEEIDILLAQADNKSIEGIINVISNPKKADYEEGIELAKKSGLVYKFWSSTHRSN